MMTLNLELCNPGQLVTELSPKVREQAWAKSQIAATPQSRWQTYLNQLILDALVPLVAEEQAESVRLWSNRHSLINISELVNGTAIMVGDAKLVLIPTEALDLEELRVPQEWIDIPEWAGDYYLGVQVNVDDGLMRIWGYTTHHQLKTSATYDYRDRHYTMDGTDLIADLNALWVARELCPEEVTKISLPVIPEISLTQAENLMQRLVNPGNFLSRLAIPFPTWAGLIQNAAWRNHLVEKRRGIERGSVLNWFQTEVAHLIQEFGWRQIDFQPSMLGARGVPETVDPQPALAKRLTIASQPYELKIIPLESDTWGFELRSLALGGMIPTGFTLRLLTAERQNFPGNEAIAKRPTEMLYLEVALDSGEGLIWEIEPTPDDYQAEVLKF